MLLVKLAFFYILLLFAFFLLALGFTLLFLILREDLVSLTVECVEHEQLREHLEHLSAVLIGLVDHGVANKIEIDKLGELFLQE